MDHWMSRWALRKTAGQLVQQAIISADVQSSSVLQSPFSIRDSIQPPQSAPFSFHARGLRIAVSSPLYDPGWSAGGQSLVAGPFLRTTANGSTSSSA